MAWHTDLQTDYDNKSHTIVKRPSLSKYIIIVLVPYMVVSSIAFAIIFPLLYKETSLQIILGFLLVYWTIVWGTYTIVKLLYEIVNSDQKSHKPEEKHLSVKNKTFDSHIQFQIDDNAQFGYAKGASGQAIQYQAKAIAPKPDYAPVFDNVSVDKRKYKREKELGAKFAPQFAHIKRLIKQKQYNEARYALSFLDHPKADKWLEKLNALDPNYQENPVLLKLLTIVSIIVLLLMNLVVSVYGILN